MLTDKAEENVKFVIVSQLLTVMFSICLSNSNYEISLVKEVFAQREPCAAHAHDPSGPSCFEMLMCLFSEDSSHLLFAVLILAWATFLSYWRTFLLSSKVSFHISLFFVFFRRILPEYILPIVSLFRCCSWCSHSYKCSTEDAGKIQNSVEGSVWPLPWSENDEWPQWTC